MSKAGEFEIQVRGGAYDCYCEISHRGKLLASLWPSELSDLKYAVEKAMQEAALRGENVRREVYT